MNTSSLKWIVSVVAIAIASSAGTAHADPPKGAPQGIMAFPSVRYQVTQNAKQSGVYVTGQHQSPRVSIRYAGDKAFATVTAKSNFGGGAAPTAVTRRTVATAEFKLQRLPDGTLAKPVKQGGEVWQRLLLAPARPAK